MITKNYIKMCEGAKQLQKNWKPKVGDYVWRKYTFFGEEIDKQFWDKEKMKEIIILTYASEIEGYFHATKDGETRIFNSHNEAHKKTCIYLPTQEQLQEMVMPTLKKKYNKVWDLKKMNREGNWVIRIFLHFLEDFVEWNHSNDITELWLAFVMKEKYHKTWSGKIWEKKIYFT